MSPADPSGPRIGVAYTGDAEDPTARSGTPYGVLSGVRSLGFGAEALRATPGKQLDRAVAGLDAIAHVLGERATGHPAPSFRAAYKGAHLGQRTSRTRSKALQVRQRRQPVELILALGSGYETPPGVPYVVYDDMTVVQAIAAGYPEWASMRESDRRFRLDQQRRRYHAAVACCMTTSWAAKSVRDDYGVAPDRIVVVGAGTHEVRRDVPRAWDRPRFLFVGLNWSRKNGDRVLRAFEQVRGVHPEATLDVVGGHPTLNAAGVTTWGKLSRADPVQRDLLRARFDAATCFVMPSLHEPGGVVFLEASSVGVGAIGGNVGGSVDFVGDAGEIVDPTSEGQITEAMLRFCDMSYAQEMGTRAYARSALFAWSQVAGRLLAAAGVDGVDVASLGTAAY